MSPVVFEVHESPEGGFEASAIGHRIHTEADTWDDLKDQVREAVRCHFADDVRPDLIRLIWAREELLSA